MGLGIVEHAVGAGEGLDQAMVLELLIDVEGVEVFRVEAGQEHIDYDGDVDLVGLGLRIGLAQVGGGEALGFDAVLHVLVVGVEIGEAVVGAVAVVVGGEDSFEGLLLFVGLDLVVLQLLREVFLELLDIGVALGGRGEDAGNVERAEVGVDLLIPALHGGEEFVVGDGVVDRGGGEKGVELAPGSDLVVPCEDGIDDGVLRSGSILLPCFWDSVAGSSSYFWELGAGSFSYFGILSDIVTNGAHGALVAHDMIVRFMLPELSGLA